MCKLVSVSCKCKRRIVLVAVFFHVLGWLTWLSKGSTLIGLCDVLRGRGPLCFMFVMWCIFHLTPVNRNFRLVIINFTDNIWLISINIGSYLCKGRKENCKFFHLLRWKLKKCIFIFLSSLVRIIIIYMYSISHLPFLSSCRTNVLVSQAYCLLDLRP